MSNNTSVLLLSVIISLSSVTYANESCKVIVEQENPKIALLKEPLSPELQIRLNALVENDPELKKFLENPDFIRFMQALGEGKSVNEMRPLINALWKDQELSDTYIGKKTGALLIGPNANNNSKLVEIIREAEIDKVANKNMSRGEKLKFLASRMKDQIAGLGRSMKKSKAIVEEEMHPTAMDQNLFDFYGYLNLRLRGSQLREWETPQNSFQGVKLSDIKDIDPAAFVKVLMLASQIEAPVDEYSDASGHIFHLYPQASRFMGKTQEQAAYHRKQRERLYCTNSWCEEENRHEGLLENLSRRLLGFVLPNTRPFKSDKSLSPFRPEDVTFHVMARANNELAASSTYIVLGGHAEGNTAIYLKNIRGDELKHSTVFTGLYHYLQGNTYWKRLKGVILKTLIEVVDKNENSEYAEVLTSEPVSMIEFIYTQVKYEQKVKNYLSILPLKTLRKFFETDINLDPLPEEGMDPAKKQRIDQLASLEKSRRESLANWPKAQREAAYKLEYFESEYNDVLSKMVAGNFKYFAGAEDYGSAQHNAVVSKINSMTAADLTAAGITNPTKVQLELAKKSLFATLRDYQIMNNRKVRKAGLKVQFIDSIKGFEIAKDEAYEKLEKVEAKKKTPPVYEAQTSVTDVKRVTDSTWVVRLNKPQGFTFQAGEAAEVTIQSPQGLQTRALSMTNSPSQSYIEFAVRASDSYFKEALMKLKAGDVVGLGKPKGALKFKTDKPAVMIAGGIGITPFRSILQNVIETKAGTPVTLLYSNRTSKDVPFMKELDSLAAQSNGSIKIDYLVSEAENGWKGSVGRIDEAYLKNVVQQAQADTVYYIVAPLPMVQGVKQALAALGVPATQVVVESFPGYR